MLIQNVLALLKIDDFYNESELIDIAKGKYQLPRSYKGFKNTVKRRLKYHGRKSN